MPKAMWKGSISFGLVNVPCALFTATSEKDIRFKQINGKTGALVKQSRVDAVTNDEVLYEDIVKGYEITPDRYVTIDPDELAQIANKRSERIDIDEFVSIGDIDPIAFKKAYHIGPIQGGNKAYRLLAEGMAAAGKAAHGSIVFKTKKSRCVIQPHGDRLVCYLLHWADEVIPPSAIDMDPCPEPTEAERAMAIQLVESLTVPFDHAAWVDEYREQVLDLIERKAAGEEILAPPAAEQEPDMPDLMAALEASLSAVRDGASTRPSATKGRRREVAPGTVPDDEKTKRENLFA